MVLVTLANATGILGITFSKPELADRKPRLERIKEGGVAVKAAGSDVQAIRAAEAAQAAAVSAMTMAVTIPIITTT